MSREPGSSGPGGAPAGNNYFVSGFARVVKIRANAELAGEYNPNNSGFGDKYKHATGRTLNRSAKALRQSSSVAGTAILNITG